MTEMKKLTLVYGGTSSSDTEDALNEALRLLKKGFTEGSDSSADGGFYFTVSSEVPEHEWPQGVKKVRQVIVVALPATAPESIHEEDEDVGGFYLVHVAEDAEGLANAALDAFHENLAVKVLDDFVFVVVDARTGEEIPEVEGIESYTLGASASYFGCCEWPLDASKLNELRDKYAK